MSESKVPSTDTGQRPQSDDQGNDIAGEGRISRRTTAFVLASLALVIVGVVLALQFFVVERLPELTDAELAAAKKRWQENEPVSYDMDIQILGAQPGSAHVKVRNRVVTAATRNGKDTPERTWSTWTVPGMFEMLSRDLEIAEDPQKAIEAAPGTKWRLWAEFDPQFGYPRRYHQIVYGGGPEVYWKVVQFTPK
jgi:hypothetical protein